MNKLIFFFLVIFLISGKAFTQSCLPEGIDFYHQTDVDNFHFNYQNCKIIEGNVRISGPDINNLDSLIGLTSILGNLQIGGGMYNDNINLASLHGLDSLTSIGGNLRIVQNPILANLDGLQNLSSVEGELMINANNNLGNILGLGNLELLGGSLIIAGNASLQSLTGLEDLTMIDGDLKVSGCDVMNLAGLNNLTNISGTLEIAQNYSLTNFEGLEMLTSIGSNFYIEENTSLVNFTGLSSVTTLGGYMYFSDNSNLTNLEGLSSLTTIDGLFIYNNDALLNLTGLEGLNKISSEFYLEYNEVLTSLIGLDNLDSIGLALRISHNPALITLSGLGSLTHIDSSLRIYQNSHLSSLAGIDQLNASSLDDLGIYSNDSLEECNVESLCNYLATPSGIVTIYGNKTGCNNPSEIADQCGFTLPCLPFGDYYLQNQMEIDNFQTLYPDCTYLGGKTEISGPDIDNLLGLSILEGFERQLKINNNPLLEDLSGLEGITYIGKSLHISGNDNLTSLTGLGNFNTNDLIVMTVIFNNSLTYCAIKSVCEFIENHEPGTDISIYYNNKGCNDEQEVESACLAGVEDNVSGDFIQVYPNPVNNVLNFRLMNSIPCKFTIKIFNTQQQEILTLLHSEIVSGPCLITWSAETLSPGLYFYKISQQDDPHTYQGKFIVVR